VAPNGISPSLFGLIERGAQRRPSEASSLRGRIELRFSEDFAPIQITFESGGILVEDVAGGVRLATRPEVVGWLRRFFDVASGNKLSMAALETLAIIAYRQPMTGPEIQELRGVSAAGVLKTLLERRLVRIVGRKEVVGKPFLYGTTREFLVHFGLNSLKDLPPLEEFEETFGSGDASAVAGLVEMAGLPPRLDEVESRGEDREEQILREIADLEERQEEAETHE
jgi:segregation and condensation protein B